MDKLFRVRKEDRGGITGAVSALLGIGIIIAFVFSVTAAGHDPGEITDLVFAVLQFGFVVAGLSSLLDDGLFVLCRALSLLVIAGTSVILFLFAGTESIHGGFGFLSKMLLVMKCAAIFIAAAAMLFAGSDRLRGIIGFIGVGAVALDFIIFVLLVLNCGSRSLDFSPMWILAYLTDKNDIIYVYKYDLIWLFDGGVLACMAVPLLRSRGNDPTPPPEPQMYIPQEPPVYGQPVYQQYQQPYGQPVYQQPQYQQPTQQPYTQTVYPAPEDHQHDPLFQTYYKPGTQPYAKGTPALTEQQQLARLDDLYARGAITYQDYQNQKADILDGF